MRYAGIDEAGYGPTLGPLAVVAVAIDAVPGLDLARAFAGTGVRDSKTLHRPGNLAPLEQVALGGLAWLFGRQPQHAGEVFAALDEQPGDRVLPWQSGAESLTLPVAAVNIPRWSLAEVHPVGLRGRLIQSRAYNDFIRGSGNKADLELSVVQRLLAWAADVTPTEVVVDRLGGRRFYRDALQHIWPDSEIAILTETAGASRYDIVGRQVAFLVGGEAASPLTALASCIAKYARELHLMLFNRHWCAAVAGLVPTAGYPEDARRWLQAIGAERYTPVGQDLIRGWPRF